MQNERDEENKLMDSAQKEQYEKPQLKTISTQYESYGVVSNCSMGQNASKDPKKKLILYL